MSSLVLCYHAVSERWPASLAVTPDELERQLTLMVKRGYRGVTFADAASGRRGSHELAVTFDDAFSSVFEIARPVLRRLGLRATIFVPASFPAGDGPLRWDGIEHWQQTEHAHELNCATWDQLGQLAEEGWEVGSHTWSHPHLTALDAEGLHRELARSREEIETRLGVGCTSIAYPYGDVDERVAEAAASAGYDFGGALGSRLVENGPLRCPRVGIYHRDTGWRFAAKVNPFTRILKASRAWPA